MLWCNAFQNNLGKTLGTSLIKLAKDTLFNVALSIYALHKYSYDYLH